MALTADRVTNVPVPFRQLRMKDAEGALQEGVVGAGDLKVSQRAAGANPSVDVAVGACWVQVDTGTRNGLVHVYNDAVANVAISPSDATNPRIDQIGIQYNDTSIPAGTGGNTPTLRYVQGTATAGATLDNRNGAVTTGLNDWLRLADFLVPAGTNSPVTTANIRDRRPWARGAYYHQSATGGGNVASVGTADTSITGLTDTRLECSGVPVLAMFAGDVFHGTAGGLSRMTILVDGTAAQFVDAHSATVNQQVPFNNAIPLLLAAGSHTFGVRFSAPVAGTANMVNNATTNAPRFVVREDIRPNVNNT